MDKFTSQAQVEETADFQAWLDAQEVADMEAQDQVEEWHSGFARWCRS